MLRLQTSIRDFTKSIFGVATTQAGMSIANPDVCKVPAPLAPTPFPNMAQLNQANVDICSQKVMITNKAVFTMKSEIPMATGDEAGSAGGLILGQLKGPAKPKKGSNFIKIGGQPVIFQTCTFDHNVNNANAPAGVHAQPSQTKVLGSG